MTDGQHGNGHGGGGACRILCLSHLAWERTLFQRPQQLMQRLAARGHQVVYAGCVGVKAALRRGSYGGSSGAPAGGAEAGVRWVHLPAAPTSSSLQALRSWYAARRLRQELARLAPPPGVPTVLWLYHPALLALGKAVCPEAPVVYDVMDRFSAFASSPETVKLQEAEALRAASVVFTGGRSIDRAIRAAAAEAGADAAAATHCFPSGIDLDHFARAFDSGTPVPDDLARLPRPVFGYFGAVDERVDFELLERLAGAWPEGSVVVIGPVLTRPGEGLPPNLHLLGGRPYDQLPGYLRGFNVCLLPFRNTPLVAHVSPTKTPEYLAGGRPVVSTPIPDVAADYGEVVRVAGTPEEFIRACGEALEAPPDPAFLNAEARRRALTWDQIAGRMDRIVCEVLGSAAECGQNA